MSDGGYYAIKGFEFQIDKTILELFSTDDGTPVSIEQIQDINTDNFVIQVKYRETTHYTPSKIKEPVIQLIDEYDKCPTKKYYLYCYFNDIEEEIKRITIGDLNGILGNKAENYSNQLKTSFVSSFELHFSKSFQDQFIQAVNIITENITHSNFDEALVHYGSITNHLRKIVTNNPDLSDRICTKSEIMEIITGNRKIVFDSAFRIYKGNQQYIAEIKKRYFTYGNIDNWERFIIVELNERDDYSTIKTIVLDIKNKFYVKLTRGIKSGAPYIYFRNISTDTLKRLKKELITENYTIRDGYDFMDADFDTKLLKVKSTIENEISMKFINCEEDFNMIIDCDLGCAKKIYQFHHAAPADIEYDIETVNIEITELSELQQILN